jgi:hypothetical protein
MLSPGTGVPGGVAAAVGVYVDFGNLEVGTYERYEMRWAAGQYAGAGVEAGVTRDRASFEGDSVVGFAEGGALQKFGVSGNANGVCGSYGVGTPSGAAGVAVTHTELEPALRADQALDWGPSFLLRRGP